MSTRSEQFLNLRLQKPAVVALLSALCVSQAGAQLPVVPIITVQPTNQNVLIRGTAFLAVQAYSLLGVSYQWYHNGAAISGANQSTCIISNLGPADAGSYYVEARNLVGPVNSQTVTVSLTFIPPYCGAAAKANDGFRMRMSGPVLYTYVTWASTDQRNWIPISTNTALDGQAIVTDTAADRYPVRFYRVALGGATGILEQNNAGGNSVQIKKGSSGAQSFVHGTAGGPGYSISKLLVYLSRDATPPATNLVVYLGNGMNSGPVSGSIVAVSPLSITNTSSGGSFQPFEIVYDNPVGPFVAGMTYYLNVECDDNSGAKVIYLERSANNYPNGTYSKGGANQGNDIRFEVWGQ